jgi:hypothetical protein
VVEQRLTVDPDRPVGDVLVDKLITRDLEAQAHRRIHERPA